MLQMYVRWVVEVASSSWRLKIFDISSIYKVQRDFAS